VNSFPFQLECNFRALGAAALAGGAEFLNHFILISGETFLSYDEPRHDQ
jgi:hypothetical protein